MSERNSSYRGSGILLDSPRGYVLLQRDDKPDISNPGMISIFGGEAEAQDASQRATAERELEEEAGLRGINLEFLGIRHGVIGDGRSSEEAIFHSFLDTAEVEQVEVKEGDRLWVIPEAQIRLQRFQITPVAHFAIELYSKQHASRQVLSN